jgi:GTP-binding protein HflX
VSDTVGFIRNLPHGLVASFKTTLDEALEATLLVHVVDVSDPGFVEQIRVTERVLADVGAMHVPRILLFNKADRVADAAAMRRSLAEVWPSAHVLSAHRSDDVRALHATLVAHFSRELVEDELRVGWDNQRVRGEIFSTCQVIGERAAEEAAFFRVRAAPDVLERIKEQLR